MKAWLTEPPVGGATASDATTVLIFAVSTTTEGVNGLGRELDGYLVAELCNGDIRIGDLFDDRCVTGCHDCLQMTRSRASLQC